MTDEELIARLRSACFLAFDDGTNDYSSAPDAADRIEALEGERDKYRDAFNTNCLVLRGTEEHVERLEAALWKIGKTYPADNMRLIHSELHILNIVNAALKGDKT